MKRKIFFATALLCSGLTASGNAAAHRVYDLHGVSIVHHHTAEVVPLARTAYRRGHHGRAYGHARRRTVGGTHCSQPGFSGYPSRYYCSHGFGLYGYRPGSPAYYGHHGVRFHYHAR